MTKTVKGQKIFLYINLGFALNCLILWKINMNINYSWLYVIAYLCCTLPVMFDVIFKGFAFPMLRDFRIKRNNRAVLFIITFMLILFIPYNIINFNFVNFCIIAGVLIPGFIIQIDAIKKSINN